jgi:multiple sugar transport system permease protein
VRTGASATRWLFVAPAVAFLAVTLVYPVTRNVVTSFQRADAESQLTGDTPFIGLVNYESLLASGQIQQSLAVTLIFVAGSILAQFVIGYALALAFNRQFPGRQWQQGILILAMMLPGIVTGVVFRWMLDGSYGIVNAVLVGSGLLGEGTFWLNGRETALLSVIAMNTWVGTPFVMALLIAGLKTIPEQTLEAAQMDGASSWQRFRHIVWPIMLPVTATTLVLSTVFTFKVFDSVFAMTAGGPAFSTQMMTLLVYDLNFRFFRFGEGAAAANILLVVPLLVAALYIFATRREQRDR